MHAADLDGHITEATAVCRQLGLSGVVQKLPSEAAGLREYIKQRQSHVHYAVAAVANGDWLLLQCCQGAVAGPVALLQQCELELHYTSQAFLPASCLGLRVLDCMDALRFSLFANAAPASAEQSTAAPQGSSSSLSLPDTALAGHGGDLWVLAGHLEESVAMAYLTDADVQALLQLVESVADLLKLDISAPVEAALAGVSDASDRLDRFKLALTGAAGQLQQGRVVLQTWVQDRLLPRGEQLQKEVLKSELALVGRVYEQDVTSTQAEHLQYLQNPGVELWQKGGEEAEEGQFSAGPAIRGVQPAWDVIQLSDVANLPALLKLLEAQRPSGQLLPNSPAVLQWFAQPQIIEACVRNGIEGQGQLLQSVYDFCPQVLRVSSLLSDHRRNALLAKQLLQQPLSSIMAACASSAYGSSVISPSEIGASSRPAVSSSPNDDHGSSQSSADNLRTSSDTKGPVGVEESGEHAAAAILSELLRSRELDSTHTAATSLNSGGSKSDGEPGQLQVLERLQRSELWTFDQISEVVWEELSTVMSELAAEGLACSRQELESLRGVWVEGCDELVEARRRARRNIFQKILDKVGPQAKSVNSGCQI